MSESKNAMRVWKENLRGNNNPGCFVLWPTVSQQWTDPTNGNQWQWQQELPVDYHPGKS